MSRLAVLLTKARGKRTQTEIAGLLNVSQPLIWKWENNKGAPVLNDVPLVSRVYGIDGDELRDLVLARLMSNGKRRRKARLS